MKATRFMLAIVAILHFSISQAQIFTKVTANLDQVDKGGCRFGDLDNDGDYDLITTGLNLAGESKTSVYLNDDGSFLKINAGLPVFGRAVIDLADFDNDLDLDLIVHSVGKIQIFRNDEGTFTLMPGEGAGVGSTEVRSLKWVDLDNDNILEILVSGGDTNDQGIFQYVTRIYHYNNGVFETQTHNIPGHGYGTITTADFNRDGLRDLILSSKAEGTYSSHPALLINNGNLNFTSVADDLFSEFQVGSSAMPGDFNDDGYPDVVICGGIQNPTGGPPAYVGKSKVLLNDQQLGFEETSIALDGMMDAFIEVADFNLDGRDDIFISGNGAEGTSFNQEAALYVNGDDMNFAKADFTFANSNLWGKAEIVDFNNDNKPDIFVTGTDTDVIEPSVALYLNNFQVENQAPSSPSGLDFIPDDETVTINWSPSIDDKSNHLKYNVKVVADETVLVLNPALEGAFPLTYNTFTTIDTSVTVKLNGHGLFYATVQAIDNSYIHSAVTTAEFSTEPVSEFTVAKDTICSGEGLAFRSRFKTYSSMFHWYLDGIEIDSAKSPSWYPVIDDPGTHTVSLVVTQGIKQSNETAIDILVIARPEVSFSIPPRSCTTDTVSIEFTPAKNDSTTFVWAADGGNLLQENDSTIFVAWPFEGSKSVVLTATNTHTGCSSSVSQLININPYPSGIINGTAQLCVHEDHEFAYDGDANDATEFQWALNGAEATGDNSGPMIVVHWTEPGEKTIRLSITQDGCLAYTSTSVIINDYPEISFDAPAQICHNDSYQIVYTGDEGELTWDLNGAVITSNTNVENITNFEWPTQGHKTLGLTVMANGCSTDTTIFVTITSLPAKPEICGVMVDSVSEKNLLVWQNNSLTANEFIVYRETNESDVYSAIGTASGKGLLSFTDVDSDPAAHAYRYRITAIDSCGAESEPSEQHKTIHLSMSRGISEGYNLTWDDYEGFPFSQYHIFRGEQADALSYLTSIQGDLHSYTDITSLNQVYYRIEATSSFSCGPEAKPLSVRSNVVSSVVTDIEQMQTVIGFYPNPASTIIHLDHHNFTDGNYEIESVTGTVISKGKVNNDAEIPVDHLSDGVYLLKLQVDGKVQYKRVVIGAHR